MNRVRLAIAALGTAAMLAASAATAQADTPAFVFPAGCCFYQGEVVRTVVPPAANPKEGRDNFYAVSGGDAGQKAIVAVAPGDVGYHGGHWKFFSVTWNTAPYLLTSEAAVLTAQATGEVTVTRVAANDFKCPIQP